MINKKIETKSSFIKGKASRNKTKIVYFSQNFKECHCIVHKYEEIQHNNLKWNRITKIPKSDGFIRKKNSSCCECYFDSL